MRKLLCRHSMVFIERLRKSTVQTMALEHAQVVAELVEAVGTLGQMKAGENGVVDLFCRPAAEMAAAM
jgi:hypothetical protein